MILPSYGILVRVYTPKVSEVADRVERAIKHVQHILKVREEFPAIKSLALLVPSNYDCGNTYTALYNRLVAENLLEIVSICICTGHHSCEVLNRGMIIAGLKATHGLVVSGKAMSYFTSSAMKVIDEAFVKGAKVAGLSIDEHNDIVLDGRIQNTFAAWDILALQRVGEFDSREGVEEIAPLVRLVRKYGQCIAPINVGAGSLDIQESDTARVRHYEVMTTKLDRQSQEVLRVGSNFEEITAGIMHGYPRSVC